MRYHTCLTRMLIRSKNLCIAACPGSDKLLSTCCIFCDCWHGNVYGDGVEEEDISEQQTEEDDREETE